MNKQEKDTQSMVIEDLTVQDAEKINGGEAARNALPIIALSSGVPLIPVAGYSLLLPAVQK